MKALPVMLLAVPVLLLSGCGGDDSSSTQTSNVSFAVSDAPVDEASSVTIAFTDVELIDSEGNSTIYPVDGNYKQIDLLDYQGTNSELIVTQTPIPVGTYKNLILHISSESGVNFVDDASGTQALKQPSNKLKLGSFEVSSDATQAFTIEFDLRQSLVMRGNLNNNNGYILKPHGVSIVSNSSAASLNVTVDSSQYTNAECAVPAEDAFVYLYQGSGGTLIDMVNTSDQDYVEGATIPSDALYPYATAQADVQDGIYKFGFLPTGEYTIAFTCDTTEDNPINYDQLEIPQPLGLIISGYTLQAGENNLNMATDKD